MTRYHSQAQCRINIAGFPSLITAAQPTAQYHFSIKSAIATTCSLLHNSLYAGYQYRKNTAYQNIYLSTRLFPGKIYSQASSGINLLYAGIAIGLVF